MNNKERIVHLDLLRALAIMFVFTGHTTLSFGDDSLRFLRFGGTGVDLFFLLSGWLIGQQLFKEYHKFGNIEVKRFWFRRWMRTFPAYYVVLAMTLIQLYVTKDNVSNPIPYLFFTQNYFTDLDYFLVSWSLAVEEQFYLFVAPFLVFLLRINRPTTRFLILVSLLLIPTFVRNMGWYDNLLQTHVRWDCCIMGVMLAYVHYNFKRSWQFLIKASRILIVPFAITYLCFYIFRVFPPVEGYSDPSKLTLSLIFSVFLIKAVTTNIGPIPVLHPLIMHISTRSYSIYLLHPDALAITERLIKTETFLLYYLVAFTITLLAAEILFRVVEMPLIHARENYKFTSKRKFVTC